MQHDAAVKSLEARIRRLLETAPRPTTPPLRAGDAPLSAAMPWVDSLLGRGRPMANSSASPDLTPPADELPARVLDSGGMSRRVYRPLLGYALARAGRPLPRAWLDAARAEAEEVLRDQAPMDRAIVGLWSAALLQAATGGSDAVALQTLRRAAEAQSADGALIRHGREDHPELYWYCELVALHALASAAGDDAVVGRAIERAAAHHAAEIQPDHATLQPWAVHAFARSAASRSLVDQMLHHAEMLLVGGDMVTLLLLGDALYCLRS